MSGGGHIQLSCNAGIHNDGQCLSIPVSDIYIGLSFPYNSTKKHNVPLVESILNFASKIDVLDDY